MSKVQLFYVVKSRLESEFDVVLKAFGREDVDYLEVVNNLHKKSAENYCAELNEAAETWRIIVNAN